MCFTCCKGPHEIGPLEAGRFPFEEGPPFQVPPPFQGLSPENVFDKQQSFQRSLRHFYQISVGQSNEEQAVYGDDFNSYGGIGRIDPDQDFQQYGKFINEFMTDFCANESSYGWHGKENNGGEVDNVVVFVVVLIARLEPRSQDKFSRGWSFGRNAPHRASPRRTAPHRAATHRAATQRTATQRTAPQRNAPRRNATKRTETQRQARI